ncbi:MAG: double-strand break repair helicase AddA, partial [Proteobacteria bacterium]|nr:double-strand break repair helicase AddA [Pseudomonadota bacterium]
LDRPATVEPARAPRPRPPLEARPATLSVTQVQTWLADPYAIYARHILELHPLDELDEDASANVRGTFVHDALETFVRRYPTTLPDDPLAELIAIGEAALSGPLGRPAVRAIWWRRFERIAAWFVAVERQRRKELAVVHAETSGRLVLDGDGERPFTLIAKADRIEIANDGSVRIIDYKTGSVPTDKAILSGRAPQLPLEAAMVRAGGFKGIAAAGVAEIAHWKLSGGQPAGECKPARGKDVTPDAIAEDAQAGLARLVGAFASPQTPYLDHPGGAPIGPWDAYTDIARTQEWRLAPGDDPQGMLPDLPAPLEGPGARRPRGPNPAQQRMSDPERTVWVAASAGTGKTKVLTDRVLRLLLCGTAPSRILCLTFTKAAAAEMAIRVRHELAAWLALDDAALEEELGALMGRGPDEAERHRARHLFAQVLDAPGGLQIATIHSFCQSLLGRFPLEAGVPPQFALIEERGRDELLHSARERVLSRIVESRDAALAADLDTLAMRAGEARVAELIAEVCASARRLRRAIAYHGSLEAMITALRTGLGLAPEDSEESIAAAACALDGNSQTALRRAAAGLVQGGKTDGERAGRIATWLAADPDGRIAGLAEYQRAFLTGARAPVKNLATKAVLKADPEIEVILAREQDRLVALDEKQRAMETLTRTAVLLRIGHAVIEEFRRLKHDRAVLDYDDLIEKAQELLAHDGMAPWVLFKLDGGIDHILVDEAQDTNPSQWSVVLALTGEFFAGEGASEIVRTLFVVGDEKQSIFSFQGADLDALRAVHRHLRGRVQTNPGAWLEEPLDVSYRSVPAVLEIVDAVFAHAVAAEGVAFDGARIEHGSNRGEDAGLVELWPPVEDELVEERDVWLAPLEDSQPRDRHTRLAAGIAGRIARMVGDDGEILESRGTPIRAGDIMILVRKRSDVVAALVRELRRANIPVAGVDRMDLTAQVVVRDLMALGRFCLMPEDDVALAAVLKGPFVDFDDDTLYALAHGRPRRQGDGERRPRPEALWATLRRRCRENDAWNRARGWLGELLGLADQMAPVEFLSHVLTRPAATEDGFSGRRALIRRLGLEAQDPLDELLNLAFGFEAEHPPSLEGFLSWLGSGSAEVKREPEGAGDVVRIMTVHGAKGLQAPVVFLIDDIGSPPGQGVTLLWDDARELALWSGGADGREALARQLHEARRRRQ